MKLYLNSEIRIPKSKILLATLFLMSSWTSASEAWHRVEQTGELRWGADATGGEPYIFPDPQNPSQTIGFEVDVMNALARYLKVRPHVIQAPWEQLVPVLLRGDFDVAFNGLEITPERQYVIDFTQPYYRFAEQITVRKGDQRFHTFMDLRGHRIGTLSGSLALLMMTDDGHMTPMAYPSPVEIYEDLALGRTDAVLLDIPIAVWYARPNPALENVGEPVGNGLYAGGIRKDSPVLREKLNDAIHALQQSGELEAIYRKWNLWNEDQRALAAENKKNTSSPFLEKHWASYVPLLLKGAGMTVIISILSMALAIFGGWGLCLGKLYGPWLTQKLCSAFIEVVRGTPLLVQLYLLYYGLPTIGIQLNAFIAAVLGMGMNYAAYEAEIYRAGLLSISKGQEEAARSLGLTHRQSLWHILLPQAFRTILPPSTNDFVALFKDTSIVSVITVTELTRAYNLSSTASYRFLELGIVTAALYFLMSYPLALWSKQLEKKRHAIH